MSDKPGNKKVCSPVIPGSFNFTCENTYSSEVNFNFPYTPCDCVDEENTGKVCSPVIPGSFNFTCENTYSHKVDFHFPYTPCDCVDEPINGQLLDFKIYHGDYSDSGIIVGKLITPNNHLHGNNVHFELTQQKQLFFSGLNDYHLNVQSFRVHGILKPKDILTSHSIADVELNVPKQAIISSDISTAYRCDFELQTEKYTILSFDNSSGNNVSVTLNTYTILGNINSYDGRIVNIDISVPVRITATFESNTRYGHATTFDIKYAKTLRWLEAYNGNYVTFDLNLLPAIPFNFNVEYGASAVSSIERTIIIKGVNAQHGHNVEQISIVEDIASRPPKLNAYYGQYLPVVHLRTELNNFTQLFYSGEEVTASFEIKPAPLLEFDIPYGYNFTALSLERLKGVTLRPYNITSGHWFNVEMDNTSTIFSLCKSCKPLIGCTFHIDFDRYNSYLWEYSANVKVDVDIKLSTYSRLYFDCFSGYHSEARLFENYLLIGSEGIEFFTDHTLKHDILWYPKTFVFDNTGNILDADFADVDMDEKEPPREMLNHAMYGEELNLMLSTTPHGKVNYHYGEYVSFYFVNWEWPKFYYGHSVTFILNTTIKFQANIYRDNSQVMYEEPLVVPMFTGHHMEVKMRTDYAVDFEETGCVSNEYIKFDENGEPDYKNSTTSAIEFERFEYSIKGTCY